MNAETPHQQNAPQGPADGQDVVDLWAACFADVASLPDAWIATLDAVERDHLARLKPLRRAIGYAGRHTMLRTVVGPVVGSSPEQLRFEEGPFGKPALADHDGPCFSLSSADEVAVLAISRNAAIGVDIVRMGPIEAGVATLFTAAEQAMLAPLGEPALSATLFRLWVVKEAALKASGLGLSVAPDKVAVQHPRDDAGPIRVTLLEGTPTTYVARVLPITATIIGAVASERAVEVRLRWWRRCQWRAACSACTTSLIA